MNMDKKQAISILGLNSDYTQEDVKKRYRILAMKFHPDKQGGSKESFEKITAARDYLESSEKTVEFTIGSSKYTATMEEFERLRRMSTDLAERLEEMRYKDNVAFLNVLSILVLFGLLYVVNYVFVWPFFFKILTNSILQIAFKLFLWYLEINIFIGVVPAIGKHVYGERIYRKYTNIKLFK